MAKYIEEYLVSLGYDLDSTDGKEYQKMLDDISKRQKNLDDESKKSSDTQKNESKKRTDNRKQENNAMIDMEKTIKQLAGLSSKLGEGDIFGSFLSGAASIKTLEKLMNGLSDSIKETKNQSSGLGDTLSDVMNRTRRGRARRNSSAGRTDSATDYRASAEQGAGFQSGQTSQLSLESGMTGSAVAAAEGGSLAGAAAVAIPVAIAAAATAAVVAMAKMADSLANANIEVETMSKKMWITDSSAWKLNNTLQAMGKTTEDLNDIALNDTLRKQFNDLQAYQEETLQLPSDFVDANEKWALSVGEANQKLSASWLHLKEVASYNFEKTFGPGISNLENNLADFITQLSDGTFFTKDYWVRSDDSTSKSTGTDSSVVSSAIGTVSNGSNYAPQSSSYATSNSSNMTVTSSPTINVYPQSGDPQAIANATSDTFISSFNDIALIKNLQSASR
jgi:hypothetical protein